MVATASVARRHESDAGLKLGLPSRSVGRCQGENQIKGGLFSRLAANRYVPAHAADEHIAHRKAQAGPLAGVFGGKKRIEDVPRMFLWNTAPIVSERNFQPRLRCRLTWGVGRGNGAGDGDHPGDVFPFGKDGIPRIDQQVDKHLAELLGVGQDSVPHRRKAPA